MFAYSLFAYVVSGPCRLLLIRGDTYQRECICTEGWPAIGSSFELSPSQPIVLKYVGLEDWYRVDLGSM